MIFKKLNKFLVGFAAAALFIVPASAAAEGIPEQLVPMGELIGISLQTRGVIVAGVKDVETEQGSASPAKTAGIETGDVILEVNGEEVDSVEELTEELSECDGTVSVKLLRDGKEHQVTVEPARHGDSVSMGVWVRDKLTGIGTLTFYDPETGIFGALGHSVSDIDTGEPVEFKAGTVTPAEVSGVTVGKPGAPGQLGGMFEIENGIGIIVENRESGIYGVLEDEDRENAVPIARLSEIKVGPAKILSTVSGGDTREYDIEIVRVYGGEDTRNMMIKVTDDELIGITGGIVQGMSGSPIIQNGKLIGAVTHVLISEPTKGYGISIEKMLEPIYGT